MVNSINFNAQCEHSKAFNRIFGLIFFLISLLSLSLLAKVFYRAYQFGIYTEPKAMMFLGIAFGLLLAPFILITLICFIVSMVKGKNFVSTPAINTTLISKAFTYTLMIVYGMPISINFIDLIILPIVLIIYVILETKQYNKEKGKALTVMQIIKFVLTILLLYAIIILVNPIITSSFYYATAFENLFLPFFVSLFFVLIVGSYYTTINTRIPKSGLASAIIIFILENALIVYSFWTVYKASGDPRNIIALAKDMEFIIINTIVLNYFIFTIILHCITNARKKYLRKRISEENQNNHVMVEEPVVNNTVEEVVPATTEPVEQEIPEVTMPEEINVEEPEAIEPIEESVEVPVFEEPVEESTDTVEVTEESIEVPVEEPKIEEQVDDSVDEYKKAKEEMAKLGFDDYNEYLDYLEFMKIQKSRRGE